jgi:hypothetical protein
LSINIVAKASGNFGEASTLLVLSTPFFIDAIFSMIAIYQAVIMNVSDNLKQDLLSFKETEEE